MHRSSGKPRLVMVIEPENRIRFRYESEGASHGGLMGKQKEKGKKIYPTVKLEGYKGKKPVFVRASLYTEDNVPHVLEFRSPDSGESVPYITEYLQEDNTAVFTNIRFLNKKKEEICELLMEQKLKKLGNNSKAAKEQFKKKYAKEIKEKAKKIMNSVKLCFEAFIEDNPETSICDPLFSDLICNQKTAATGELRIHRMSRVYGSWKGGDEVILLCDKVKKESIEILFYESDPENGDWIDKGRFSPADVHYQVAITFKTPPFKTNTERTVKVSLKRDNEYGEPREFTYLPEDENPSKKRKAFANEEPALSINQYLGSPSSSSNEVTSTSDQLMPEEDEDNLRFFPETLHDLLTINDIDIDFINGITSPDEDLPFLNGIVNQSLMQIDCGAIVGQMYSASAQMGISDEHSNALEKTLKKLTLNEHPKDDLYEKKRNEIRRKIAPIFSKRDDFGNTYLHLAVQENKDVEVILKLDHFADTSIKNMKNYNQETPLHIAVQRNNKEAVEVLMKYKCDPNLRNGKGNNCYHLASENCTFDVMNCLLSHNNPLINDFNYEGITPMHIAIMKKSNDCFYLLKQHKANMKVLDKKTGRSLLHYAVEYHPHLLRTLLKEEEINVNIQDFEGNTPLHIASSNDNIEVVKQLLEVGADPTLKNFKQNSNTLQEDSDDDEDDENDGQLPADSTTNLEIRQILKEAAERTSKHGETIEKLRNQLDRNMQWKKVAELVLDANFIHSLECSPSPANALLQFLKKEKKEDYLDYLESLLEIAGLIEVLDIIKESKNS